MRGGGVLLDEGGSGGRISGEEETNSSTGEANSGSVGGSRAGDGQAADGLAFRAWAMSKTPDLHEAATSADASWY
jgi:hypothetical protein